MYEFRILDNFHCMRVSFNVGFLSFDAQTQFSIIVKINFQKKLIDHFESQFEFAIESIAYH